MYVSKHLCCSHNDCLSSAFTETQPQTGNATYKTTACLATKEEWDLVHSVRRATDWTTDPLQLGCGAVLAHWSGNTGKSTDLGTIWNSGILGESKFHAHDVNTAPYTISLFPHICIRHKGSELSYTNFLGEHTLHALSPTAGSRHQCG